MIHAEGRVGFELLHWEGEALALIDSARLAELWRAGIRDVEIEVPTSLRNGRRPFRILRLAADGSCWLVPPAFLHRLTDGGLDGHWQ